MADHPDREDRLRRNLVGDVAHELRTPLAILQGSTEALIDGVDQPISAVLASLNDEVTRLGRLVGDLETLAPPKQPGCARLPTPPAPSRTASACTVVWPNPE